jgi:hypothetical protein
MGRKRKHKTVASEPPLPTKKHVSLSREGKQQKAELVPPTLQGAASANNAVRDVLGSGQWALACCSHSSCNCRGFALQAGGLLCENCSHRAAAHQLSSKQLAGPVSTQRLAQLFVHVRNVRAAAADGDTACWGNILGSQHVLQMLAAVSVNMCQTHVYHFQTRWQFCHKLMLHPALPLWMQACQLAAALSSTLHDASSAVHALQTAQALAAQQVGECTQ